MKVMFVAVIGALICGCSCQTALQFVKRDLEGAMFEYHQKDGVLREVGWNDFDQQGKMGA